MTDLGDITDQDFDLLSEALNALAHVESGNNTMHEMLVVMLRGPQGLELLDKERAKREAATAGPRRILRERIDLLKAKLILVRQARAAERMSESVDRKPDGGG